MKCWCSRRSYSHCSPSWGLPVRWQLLVGARLTHAVFTLQSKYDFSSLGPWLFSGLMILIGVGMVQLFMPYSRTLDLVYSVGGCAIFSGYILYDTSNIMRKYVCRLWRNAH